MRNTIQSRICPQPESEGCSSVYTVSSYWIIYGGQGGRQRGVETLVRSRIGDGLEERLKELARSSSSLPAAHTEAVRACKHAGLIWHAFSYFRKALQVPPQHRACLGLADAECSQLGRVPNRLSCASDASIAVVGPSGC